MSQADRLGGPGAGAAVVAEQPVLLVRYPAGVTRQTACTVHLVLIPADCVAGRVGALCGRRLYLEEIEPVGPGVGMPCSACLATRAITTGTPVASCERDDADDVGGLAYLAWGWPVTQRGDQVQLTLDRDASAIAIPIPMCAAVTRVLTARHCAPAVLAHPGAPEHHIVLAGERFGAALPWPSGVYQVGAAVLLPPTVTVNGPITWVQPPSRDSLRLSREIDVFGALRTVISG